jgi:S1-C subfamily serine protease
MMVRPDADAVYYFSTNRGKMGITVSIRPEATDSIGALVDAVSPGGPAFKAGIRSGDLITRFNGRSVPVLARDARKASPGLALLEVAASLSVGDTARLEYRRGSNRRSVSLVLEPMVEALPFRTPLGDEQFFTQSWQFTTPDIEPYSRQDVDPLMRPFRVMAELELAPMNPGLGQYFGVTTGVLVINAPEDTWLSLKSGDVVMEVDGRRVSSPNQLFRVLRSYEPGERFRFEIVRMKRKETVTASIAER